MATRIGNKVYGADATQTGMGQQADTEPDPTDPNEPAEVAAGEPREGGDSGTQEMSQQQAQYRRANGRKCCGLCDQYVHGEDRAPMGQCVTVDGDISAYGLCNYYNDVGNPFPPMSNDQRVRVAQNRLVRAQQAAAQQGGAAPAYAPD